jgi:two-component system response regulator YesN
MKETSHDRITSKLKEVNINIQGPYYKVLLVHVDNAETFLEFSPYEKKDLPEFIAFNILEELATTYPNTELFQDSNNYTVILMGYETEEELKIRINTLYNKCNDILHKAFSLAITIGIGHTVKSFPKLSFSYEGSRSALEHSFLYGGNQILDIKRIVPRKKNEQIDITEDIKNLTLAIRLNNKTDMNNSLHTIMDKFRDSLILKDAIQVYIQTIVFSLDNLMDNVVEFDHNFILKKDELLQRLYKENTLIGMEKTITNYCIQIGEILSKQRDKFDKKQAILAKEYINNHYSNPDLTLQSMCNHLSISVSYFSSIFKSFTGETFIEALTKKRIEKAMDLLTDTSLKIYEIAEKVGFSDPQYFATTFKKYTGKTPKSYTKERLHMYGKI